MGEDSHNKYNKALMSKIQTEKKKEKKYKQKSYKAIRQTIQKNVGETVAAPYPGTSDEGEGALSIENFKMVIRPAASQSSFYHHHAQQS